MAFSRKRIVCPTRLHPQWICTFLRYFQCQLPHAACQLMSEAYCVAICEWETLQKVNNARWKAPNLAIPLVLHVKSVNVCCRAFDFSHICGITSVRASYALCFRYSSLQCENTGTQAVKIQSFNFQPASVFNGINRRLKNAANCVSRWRKQGSQVQLCNVL